MGRLHWKKTLSTPELLVLIRSVFADTGQPRDPPEGKVRKSRSHVWHFLIRCLPEASQEGVIFPLFFFFF